MSHDAKIDLACVDHDYRALLFKGETEIVYSNQVGGTCCSHPLVEGFFVLLNGAGPDEGQDPFYDHGPTEYREDHRLDSRGRHMRGRSWRRETCGRGQAGKGASLSTRRFCEFESRRPHYASVAKHGEGVVDERNREHGIIKIFECGRGQPVKRTSGAARVVVVDVGVQGVTPDTVPITQAAR